MSVIRTHSSSGASCRLKDEPFITTGVGNTSGDLIVQDFARVSIQMVFDGITGPQPVVKLQSSNTGDDWDDVLGATHTTTDDHESKTWWIMPCVSRYLRVYVSVASTTGTCTITAVGNGSL